MSSERIEHANVTVADIDAVLRFLAIALPTWRVRGGGTMDWFGREIRWVHVGTDEHYLALQSGGEGEVPGWRTHAVGVKHIGIEVPSVDAVIERLADAGHRLDHWGGSHPFRRSVYFTESKTVQFEFVEYLSDDPALRHDYER